MKRASKRTGGLYQGIGFLKFIFCYMYSLRFSAYESAEALRDLPSFPLLPFLTFFFSNSLSLSRYPREHWSSASSGPLHPRFVTPVLSSYLTGKIFQDAYLAQLHQISHVAEHLLNLLTLRASRELRRKLGKISLLVLPAN